MSLNSLLSQPEQQTKSSATSLKLLTVTPEPQKEPEKQKKKRAPKSAKPEHKCEFCKKDFARESTLLAHACEKKKRWLNKDEKYVRMGFMAYKKFYDISYRGAKTVDYLAFMNSSHYTSFVKFGRYLLDIQVINAEAFIEFLLKANIPMKNWERDIVYEQYVRELNKRESAETAFERNVLLMQQWEMDTGEPWYDFFRKINANVAVQYIRSGRLSPWVLYTASSAPDLFERFNEEQFRLIEQYVDPRFWKRKLDEQPDDVRFIRDLLDEAGA